MKYKAQRYFPKGAVIREFPEAGLVVGVVEANGKGNPQALGYYGKAQNPSFNYSFRSVERMEAFIAERVASGVASLEFKAKLKAERAAKLAEPNPLKAGDILLCSWGYDQTNAEYFQVKELIGKRSVKIQAIACKAVEGSQGFMCEDVMPVPGAFLEREPEMVKRVDEGGRVKIHSFASAHKVDPNSKTYSSHYA